MPAILRGGRDPPKSRIKNRESKKERNRAGSFPLFQLLLFRVLFRNEFYLFFSSLPPPTQPFPSLSFKFDRLYKFDSIETRSYYFSRTKEAKRVSRISRISGKIGTLSSLVMYRDSRHSISKSVGRSAPTTSHRRQKEKKNLLNALSQQVCVCVCVQKIRDGRFPWQEDIIFNE